MISEEVGRHGLLSGQIAVQGERWLMDWGTQEQKEQWLRGIATGEIVFSESISEKNAGSSFKTMTCPAVRDGSDWVINGAKTHVNLGADCDVTLVYAVAEEGLTSFLVDMTLEGISTEVTNPSRTSPDPHRGRVLRRRTRSDLRLLALRARACRRFSRRSTSADWAMPRS